MFPSKNKDQQKLVEISEEVFARNFQLPVEGLIDISEVQKDLIFDARTEFSLTGEQLTTSCKKWELKIEYRLLSDIVAKSITVKAGSFDVVTHERFPLMIAIFGGVSVNWGRFLFKIFKDMVTPETRQARGYAVQIYTLLKNTLDLELGDSEEFPPLNILTSKTVGRYISINEKIAIDNVEGGEKEANIEGESSSLKAKLELVSVALDAEPIQTVYPTSADDVDTIIEQVVVETTRMDTDEELETVAFETTVEKQWLQTFVEPEAAEGTEMGTVLKDPEIEAMRYELEQFLTALSMIMAIFQVMKSV
ncbi:hypothetical protein F511_19501 [Dorcoceras hygrometricum]|uniref:Uncharacterized protein n=1 Tax=Dorcoceras hygrometricum TaxID=472368 RepID=A0A2Z7C343_9LAMI|nr:hypothetical protein F511_19501 [Dorcoceras hygrometricum]